MMMINFMNYMENITKHNYGTGKRKRIFVLKENYVAILKVLKPAFNIKFCRANCKYYINVSEL